MNISHYIFHFWIKCYCYNNNYLLYVKRHIDNKILHNIIFVLSIPYVLVYYFYSAIYEKIYGFNFILKQNQKDCTKTFKHELAIVCISKNEGPYIKEWIEYHKLIGVSKFYFYDNESEDNSYKILEPYIINGLVEYKLIKGKGQQLNAYNDAIRKYKYNCRYMAFLDLDEYLFPMQEHAQDISKTISQLIQKAGKGASWLSINWCIFGSSHLKKRPQGLITENYILRGKASHWGNYHVKTICNPRRVKKYISPHYPLYHTGAYSISDGNLKRQYGWFCHDVKWKYFRINHYYCKSQEDYIIKISRGLGDRIGNYNLNQFNDYDLNDIKDDLQYLFVLLL